MILSLTNAADMYSRPPQLQVPTGSSAPSCGRQLFAVHSELTLRSYDKAQMQALDAENSSKPAEVEESKTSQKSEATHAALEVPNMPQSQQERPLIAELRSCPDLSHRSLLRKPTLPTGNRVSFAEDDSSQDTYTSEEYERGIYVRPRSATELQTIKRELIAFKREMDIHPESVHNTTLLWGIKNANARPRPPRRPSQL